MGSSLFGVLRRRVAGSRRSRLVSAGVAVSLVGSLVAGGVTAAVRSPGLPPVPQTPAAHEVQYLHLPPVVVPRAGSQRSASPGPHAWPSAGGGVAELAAVRAGSSAGLVRVAGTPVFVQPAGAGAGGPTRVAVTVASQATARKLGVTGVVFSAAARKGAGAVTVGLDYGSFAAAYGGNFGSRLRLVQLPACALTTPQAAGCSAQQAIPGAVNTAGLQRVSATVSLPAAGPVVLAATSVSYAPAAATVAPAAGTMLAATTTSYTPGNGDGGGDGGGTFGSYTATSLKPSGTWSAGGSSGDFTYSYPISVPPAASSLVPSVGLSYDSGSLDGQTAATQAQAGWAGDGWSTPENFIEQSYVPCSDDPEGSAAPQSTGDECYDGQVLTLSLNGSSTAVVYDSSTTTGYVLSADNGDVVQKVTGSGNGSGTYDTSYWVVTDRSGTKYYFGRNELPGWASGDQATNSVDSEPVFAAHSGDPCYNATWASSVCTMAYRWNLDYVVDVHGNAMAYYYDQASNAYLENAAASYTSMPDADATYIRDSYLDHIDYGFTDGSAYSVNGGHAPDQVTFSTAGRCDPSVTSCPAISSSNSGSATSDYPDVPYDLNCVKGSACLVSGPSFWSTVELTGITTWQWTGSAYTKVDQWGLTQKLPATGDGSSPTLFLASISHTGDDTTAGGAAASVPAVMFNAGNLSLGNLDNRVNPTGSFPAMTRDRISTITTESGSVIQVNYELASACTSADQASPATNTGSCYPVWWSPPGLGVQEDWFNKYQVASVSQSDPAGGSPGLLTGYKYFGGAAWHYDDNELVKAKYRTYGQYRGFGDVQTFTGQAPDPQTETESTYYRGMSDDNNTTAVTLTDSQGGSHDDTDQLAGDTLETTQYNYSGGPITGSTINSYWVSAAAASRSRPGLPALTANATGEVETWSRQALQSGSTTSWRETETDTSYYTDPKPSDPGGAYFGLPEYSYAHGDLSLPGNNQVRCTITTYEPPSAAGNIVGLPAETETDADPCGGASPAGASAPTAAETNALTAPASVSRPADVVSAACTIYDNPTLAQTWPQATATTCPQAAPSKGDISEVLSASGYSNGAFTWQARSAGIYDSTGRITAAWDANGNKTTTSYTANSYGLTTGVTTTNPLGQSSSITLDPLRGLTVSSTDLNKVTTTSNYDGLGRIIAEWGNSRWAPTTPPPPADATFSYTLPGAGTAPTVVTSNVLNDAGTYATETTLYDSLLRVRQTQDPTPQGGRLVTDTFYDSHGWVWKTNTNWWDQNNTPGGTLAPDGSPSVIVADDDVPDQTVTSFDGNGRPVLAVRNQGLGTSLTVRSETATVYDQAAPGDGDATITAPLNPQGQTYAGGAVTATVTDALGRTTGLDQYTTLPAVTVTASASPVITTVAMSGGASQATSYTFNNAGQQTAVTDQATGQSWTSGYNLLGQVTSKTDPDAGATTMAYDNNGNLLQSTDANGKTLSYSYDALNRKTAEYDAPVSAQAGSNELASWVYDNANGVSGVTDPVGQLTTSTSYVGGTGGSAYTEQARGFTGLGESTGETVTLPASEGALAGSYHFASTYRAITGVPNTSIYQASPGGGALPAETVTYGYDYANNLELADGVSGLNSYQGGSLTYTALGQPAREEIGAPSPAPNAYITNHYDSNTGQLTETYLSDSATPIDDTSYNYDPAGNPTSQTETLQTPAGATQAETQCFAYDTLDRLTQAWTATDSCTANPASNSGATVGDGIPGAAYWTNWTYSPEGLRQTETDHGLSGAASTTTSYAYNGNGASQPDTLTSTTTSGAATGSAAYKYDADGNVTSRSTTTGTTTSSQTLGWNDDGTLASVTSSSGTSNYIYDAGGSLLLEKDPGTTTLYLPNEEIILSGGQVTGNRYYTLPGGGQVVRTSTNNGTATSTSYYFELDDQHGTATLTIGPAFTTASATWRGFTPYGAPRGTTVTWVDNRGFLNKPADTTTGLTNLGARWYDPTTGTFQSLDPLFEAASPQQHNGYSYAAANPVTSSDPTGTCANMPDAPCVTDTQQDIKVWAKQSDQFMQQYWTSVISHTVDWSLNQCDAVPSCVLRKMRNLATSPDYLAENVAMYESDQVWQTLEANATTSVSSVSISDCSGYYRICHNRLVNALDAAQGTSTSTSTSASPLTNFTCSGYYRTCHNRLVNALHPAPSIEGAVGHWLLNNRGTLASMLATAGCIIPPLDAGCPAYLAAAYAVRAEQRWQTYGFKRSLQANLTDGLITAAFMTPMAGAMAAAMGDDAPALTYGTKVALNTVANIPDYVNYIWGETANRDPVYFNGGTFNW